MTILLDRASLLPLELLVVPAFQRYCNDSLLLQADGQLAPIEQMD